MTNLALSKKGIIPLWARDLFDSGNLLNSKFFDIENDFPALDFMSRIPTVNVIENTKDFKLEMAVPGLEKDDFNVSVENGIMTISAEREKEIKEDKENYTRKEFSYNSFSRSFSLPENCVSDKIDAKYEKGILKITLPKKEISSLKPAKEIKVS